MSEPAPAPLLRRATPADATALGDLTARVYLTEGYLGETDAYLDELRAGARRIDSSEVWVVEDADTPGALLAAVAFAPEGSGLRELAGDGESEFRMLVVDPAARGRGLGELLVRRCLDRSVELGCHAVVLCSLDAMTSAHRLYARLGFTREPSLDWEPRPGTWLRGFRIDLAPTAS